MAISWDFTAGAKAAAASRAAAAKEGSNLQRSIESGMRSGFQMARNREAKKREEDRAIKAQQQIFDGIKKDTADTFNETGEASNYGSINDVFDYSSQQLIKTYMDFYGNKDMDPDERALGMKKLTTQIPLLKTAKASLDKKLEEFTAATLSGEVSGAMDPKFQQMYSDLRDGKFEGGIDYINGETRLIGKTTNGDEIDLMLKEDFEKHLPTVDVSAGTITSKLQAVKESYKSKHDAYLKNPKQVPFPTFDVDSETKRIATEIGDLGGNGLKRYAVDVLKYSVEDVNEMVAAYETGVKPPPTRKKMGDKTVEHQIQGPKIQQTPLFIQQADVKYNSIMNGASIEQEDIDTTLFTNNGYPNVEKFEEKGDKLYITIGGGTQGNEKDNNFKEIPSKQVVVDLSDPRDLQKYMTNKGYDGIGQGEDIKGRDRSIMTSQKLADYYRKKELERRKEEASETGKEKNQFQKYFPENSFSGEVNEDGLPTE